jgi:hypothetical protein
MKPRCDKCAAKVKKDTKCWQMQGKVKCMLCLHQRQACTIDPGYVGPKKRRRTETDMSMRHMSTCGKSYVFANPTDVDNIVSIGETQQPTGSGVDINVEGKADLAAYLLMISSLHRPSLVSRRLRIISMRISNQQRSNYVSSSMITRRRQCSYQMLTPTSQRPRQEGESEVEEDELVKEMVDEEISRAK